MKTFLFAILFSLSFPNKPIIIEIWSKYVNNEYCYIYYVADNRKGIVLHNPRYKMKLIDCNCPSDSIIIETVRKELINDKFDKERF